MDTTLHQLLARLGQQPANNDLAHAHGLKINSITYEDLGRDKNSCVGPNISDMTLTVDDRRMPIIRKPNFSDVTCDLEIADFNVTVGNETKDGELRRIPLTEYIEKLHDFNPDTSDESQKSLLIDRDEHILASAQACVLPLGHGKDDDGNEIKEVEFVPEIFNYQSRGPDPAVMVIVVSSQGTSATVLTSRAQKLHFNRGGESVQFLAKRLSLDRKERGVEDKGDMTAEEQDRNLIMVFQIPLLKPTPPTTWVPNGWSSNIYPVQNQFPSGLLSIPRHGSVSGALLVKTDNNEDSDDSDEDMSFSLDNNPQVKQTAYMLSHNATVNCSATLDCSASVARSSRGLSNTIVHHSTPRIKSKGMENAMLRVSDTSRGVYAGLQKKKLVRDTRFPIRVTLQHYKVSDTQLLSEDSIKYIANKINSIYDNAEAQGSLVVGSSNDPKKQRPTEIKKTEVRPIPQIVSLSDSPMFSMPKRDEDWCSVSA